VLAERCATILASPTNSSWLDRVERIRPCNLRQRPRTGESRR
jgi:hypothetical protein